MWGARAFCPPFAAFCREPATAVGYEWQQLYVQHGAGPSGKMPDGASRMLAVPDSC
jgi:hypothetical protein